jgi:CheY-like chemotaxis protein/DNA-binding CsgD family transcriptional regulator
MSADPTTALQVPPAALAAPAAPAQLAALAHAAGDVVLIVDDVPDNLSLLHDALDEAGYTVLVATDGPSAIARARQARPDIVLLDAMMPGMDGFEVARRLKAGPETAAIPIVFMTALTETEHVVAAFAAGGVDYVTKPIQPREVLARIQAHTQTARVQRQARNALDAFGHATMVVRPADGRLLWQTALARGLLRDYFSSEGPFAPVPIIDWVRREAAARSAGVAPQPLLTARGGRRLTLELHAMGAAAMPSEPSRDTRRDMQPGAPAGVDDAADDDEWLIVLRESDDARTVMALMLAFKLTQREAEVLYWLAKGKTNRDIGDILGSSPATVKKQLEHVYPKLGVETRTAAASIAISTVPQLAPGR